MSDIIRTGWEWRISAPTITIAGVTARNGWDGGRFHAYGPADMAACTVGLTLFASHRPPTEGDDFCPECMGIVQRDLPR